MIRMMALSAFAAVLLPAFSHPSSAQSCEDLWYRRNSIYKQGGYCFRTARGIRAFGNAGCQYDSEYDVPLSANQRSMVAGLQAQERASGCAR